MSKLLSRQKAIELRRQGKSYSQIRQDLQVSKSSLSLWLKDYPLSKEKIRELRDLSAIRIEKYKNTMKKKREKRLEGYYREAENKLILSKDSLYICGLFLYWGEGNKASRHTISIANSDPDVIKFTLVWMKEALKIPQNKIKIYLHLYSDMNIEEEIDYWMKTLNMPRGSFSKPYIKKSTRTNINHKGFSHGTCNVSYNNTVLKEKLLMTLEALKHRYVKN